MELDTTTFVLGVLNLIPLILVHTSSKRQKKSVSFSHALTLVAYAVIVCTYLVFFATSDRVKFFDLVCATIVYATFLFVAFSEALMLGAAARLTAWRGEKWAKELDYIYLSLGAAGLIMSTNRLEGLTDRLTLPDYYGPFVLATALVIRALKTRVEVNDWNKLPA